MSDSEASEIGTNRDNPVITINKVVTFHYRLSEVDPDGHRGEWMEQSYGSEPLHFLQGFHNVVVGLERALEGKTTGDLVAVTINPEEAYGLRQEDAVQRVPIKHLEVPPATKKLVPGTLATVRLKQGPRMVIVVKVGKFNAVVDFNHPLAGKTLYYEVEVIAVRDATEEEIAHGHVHGPGHEH